MPVNIHGNQYVTVAERVQALHEDKEIKGKPLTITSEFIPNGEMIVCRATVIIGENTFTGTSAANPAKAIEKQSPYEVAETSAIGRALGFAGYGIVEGIATADEIVKATSTPTQTPPPQPVEKPSERQIIGMITEPQRRAIFAIKNSLGMTDEELKYKFRIEHTADLTSKRASEIIEELKKMQEAAK